MIDCLFFRDDFFYPVQLMEPEDCGKTLEEQAADHAELNPGTKRVQTKKAPRILWELEGSWPTDVMARAKNKGMNNTDYPWNNLDVPMTASLMNHGYQDGHSGTKTKFIDGSGVALAQAWGLGMKALEVDNERLEAEIAKLKGAHDES